MKLWFFAEKGKTLVASVECGLDFARRLAQMYNHDPSRGAAIDLIADHKEPGAATVRIVLEEEVNAPE